MTLPPRSSTGMTLPPRSSTGARLAAIIVAIALFFAAPAAALAHDRLISSDPADGAEVSETPSKVTLTFSDNVLDVSPAMRITGSDGAVVFDGEPTVEGNDVTAALDKKLPAGKATVQWRVVSSDGHPIEGDFAFTVASGASDQPKAASSSSSSASGASDAGGASPSAEPSPSTASSSAPSAEAAQSGSTGLSAGAIGAIVGAIAVVLIIGAVLVMRGSRRQ